MKAILLALALFIFSSTSKASVAPENISLVSHTAVFKRKDSTSTCTAVSVGPRALLTAAHCLKGSPDLEVDGENYEIVRAVKDGRDHALLFVKGKPFYTWAKLAFKVAQPGEDVYVVGNPDGFSKFVRKGVVAGYSESGLTVANSSVMYLDINGTKGDSGAGVFSTEGDLFTILSAVYVEDNFFLMVAFPLNFTTVQLKEARDF